MVIKFLFPFFVIIFVSSLGFSKSLNFHQISIKGLETTDLSVVMNELGFKERQIIEESQLQQGINEIRNTDLFSKVSYVIKSKGELTHLIIQVEERWTTIPILKVSSGGGVSQFTLGIYDPNLFGKYL